MLVKIMGAAATGGAEEGDVGQTARAALDRADLGRDPEAGLADVVSDRDAAEGRVAGGSHVGENILLDVLRALLHGGRDLRAAHGRAAYDRGSERLQLARIDAKGHASSFTFQRQAVACVFSLCGEMSRKRRPLSSGLADSVTSTTSPARRPGVPYGKCTYKDQTNETAPMAWAALPSVCSLARPPLVCTLQLPSYTFSLPVFGSPVSGSVVVSPWRVTTHWSVMRLSAIWRSFGRAPMRGAMLGMSTSSVVVGVVRQRDDHWFRSDDRRGKIAADTFQQHVPFLVEDGDLAATARAVDAGLHVTVVDLQHGAAHALRVERLACDGGGFHLDDGLQISLVPAPFVQHWDAVADHHFGAAEPFPDLLAFGAVEGDVAAEFNRDIVDLRPSHGITSR
uniref:Uncharacterized protein n=1 Tax=Siphoviridae sp. ctB9E3 TaxID=2826187 RepID=A0A8S5QQB0_9CAUD|nr:MAG TPA: hypothetical protein [Siphoviridae sp. ctB9E3]